MDQNVVEFDTQGIPIWALCYYSLKCGLKDDLL